MDNFNYENKDRKGLLIALIILIIVLSVGLGYFIWKDFQKVDNETPGTENEPKQVEMTAQWFDDYLTPLFITNGGLNMVNPSNKEIFIKAINLTVYLNPSAKESIGDKFLIKGEAVANNVEKYYGIKNFIYNVNDNQFIYDESRGGYLSSLAFGVGQKSGPIAEYTVNNVVYQIDDVTLNVLEDYKGEADNKEYTVKLKCTNEICVVKSINVK